MAYLILGLLLLQGTATACGNLLAQPTFTPSPVALPTPTETALPTSTVTPAPPPSATPLPPTPTATRRPTQVPTRVVQATRTVIVIPTRKLPPLVWDPRLDELGIRLIPATVPAGQPYWRLAKAEFWDEQQSQNRHHIYMNVLDEAGTRLVGQRLFVEWPDEKLVLVTEDKPAPEYSANFPLDINHYPPWGTLGAFTVWVDGLPSDKVAGMGLPSRNKPVVYWLTFQRAMR